MAVQLRVAAQMSEAVVSDKLLQRKAPVSTGKTQNVTSKPHITDTAIDSSNWYKHINWLNVTVLLIIPSIAIYHAFNTPLALKTLVWAVSYYFITGIGITAGKICPS